MLVSVIKDAFLRLNLSFDRVRDQFFDGASSMSGKKNGVAKRISELEPRAIFTHHALNLAASDTIKQSKIMKDALDTTHEVTKLINYSPRREAIFKDIKEAIPGESNPGIRVLCPTRWTVKATAFVSIMSNFETLQLTWKKAVSIVRDTETKARIHGVSVMMSTFNYLFGNMLGEMLLKHADNLSSTLQLKVFSAAEGQTVAKMTVETIKLLRNDESFDLFWLKVNQRANNLGIEGPQLPRLHKRPRRFDEGSSEGDHHENSKSLFRQHYYEAIDLIINCIDDRFNQDGHRMYHSLETLLLKACISEDFESDLNSVCQFYKDDFDQNLLHTQLQTFAMHFQQVQEIPPDPTAKINIFDVKKYILSLSPAHSYPLFQMSNVSCSSYWLCLPLMHLQRDPLVP